MACSFPSGYAPLSGAMGEDMHTTPEMAPGRLVILAGPSCVGKTPLLKALRAHHAALMEGVRDVVLYNSRAPRPGEEDGRDYHFRDRDTIEAMRDDPRYLVIEARNDLQAVDLEALRGDLDEGDRLFEGNPYVGKALAEAPGLKGAARLSVFIAPLTREEVLALRDAAEPGIESLVVAMMRRKLLRRASRLGTTLTDEARADIDTRARRAYPELRMAHLFGHVVPNHDGEDSDHWSDFPSPIGDARRCMQTVAALLEGKDALFAERWEPGLLG
jgi:guanylate kinase